MLMQKKVINERFMDVARKSFAKAFPPGGSLTVGFEQSIKKMLLSYHSPDHPPYSLMICEAIRKLNEDAGSDEESISCSIKLNYKSLPWGHDSLLSHHLKKLSEEGEIVCVSADRYTLPPEENATISLAEQRKEDIYEQKLPRNDLSQSPSEVDFEDALNTIHNGAESEVGFEQNVAEAEPEGVRDQQEPQEDHIPVTTEQPVPEVPSLPSQVQRLGLKVTEEMDHVSEEQGHEHMVNVVNEHIQLQEKKDQVNQQISSEVTNLSSQEKISEFKASDKTSQVYVEKDKSNMEDFDQVHDKTSPVVEGEIAIGQDSGEAVKVMNEWDCHQTELVENICTKVEHRGLLNNLVQVQEEPYQCPLEDQIDCQETHQHSGRHNEEGVELENVTLAKQIEKPVDHVVDEQPLEDQIDCQETHQHSDRQNEEGVELENVTLAEQIEKPVNHVVDDQPLEDQVDCQEPHQHSGRWNEEGVELENVNLAKQIEKPMDHVADDQLVHLFDQQNQQVELQTAVSGPVSLLKDMSTEIELLEKLIESCIPEYEVMRNGVKPQEEHPNVENIADNRQQDVGLIMLNKMKWIRNCLFHKLKPISMDERSTDVGLVTTDCQVPKFLQEKPEICKSHEEVSGHNITSSNSLEVMDVMLIEAEQNNYHSRDHKRPTDCAIMAHENMFESQKKRPKLSEVPDVGNSPCPVLEHSQQSVGKHGDTPLKPLEANGAMDMATPLLLGGSSSLSFPPVTSMSVINDTGDISSLKGGQLSKNSCGTVSCQQEKEDAVVLENIVRREVPRDIQSSNPVPASQEKQNKGKQSNLVVRIVEQHRGFPAQDMNQERVMQQQRVLSWGQPLNAMQMSTAGFSPSLNHDQMKRGMLLNHCQSKQFEIGATAMPLMNQEQIGCSRESRTFVPHLSPSLTAISTSTRAVQMSVIPRDAAQQQQSLASSETNRLSFPSSVSACESQLFKEPQLVSSETGNSLFKPSALGVTILNPLKPRELKRMEKLLAGQSRGKKNKERKPQKPRTKSREESPASQKKLRRPAKPKVSSVEGPPSCPRRRGRPPKRESEAVTAVLGREAGCSTPTLCPLEALQGIFNTPPKPLQGLITMMKAGSSTLSPQEACQGGFSMPPKPVQSPVMMGADPSTWSPQSAPHEGRGGCPLTPEPARASTKEPKLRP